MAQHRRSLRPIASGWAAAEFFEPPSGGGWKIGTHVYVLAEGLNLRNYPGLAGTILATLPRHTHLITSRAAVHRDGYTWYGVVSDTGAEGFVAGDFLTTTPHTDATDGFAAGTSVRVTANGLRLREGPGTSHGVIGTYARGADGQILEGPVASDGYRWYRIEMYSDGSTGWMADAYLEIARYEPTGSRLRVVDGPLNLREWGSLGAPVITAIPVGDVVVVADAAGVVNDGYTWWYVSLEMDPNVLGWIATGFTEEIG